MRESQARTPVRCAIYTRKSTEDGLEQEYNSLEAQRDACASYILSQRQEGWTLLPDRYDDGGFSGGNMERPGLKRLMADVAAGKVDTIVIYKVDRLTRSLSDFAKIVEVLDEADASFVSVTQAFNTTTSMGRLTLNMLLSFAQFEREVTGERIRDKIAASKRKGLWMGGPLPLGYDVRERKLVVNETEAGLVRHIYQRYLALSSVNELVVELAREGHRTKLQRRASGPHRGDVRFQRGTLYHLLSNRIYRGMIVHKGEAHPGEHLPIVPEQLWIEVQEKLAARGPGLIVKRNTPHRSWLVGMLFDGLGRPMTSSHASKGTRRYRYYVTRNAAADQPAWRTSAHDLEQIVADRIVALLNDRNRICRLAMEVDPRLMERAASGAYERARSTKLMTELATLGVDRIDLHEDRVSVSICGDRLLRWCGIEREPSLERTLHLEAPVIRVRRGHELRLVIEGEGSNPDSAAASKRDDKLVQLMAEAFKARALILASPDKPISRLAADQGCCRSRLSKLFAISHLSPALVQQIMAGAQPPALSVHKLLAIDLPVNWEEQRRALEAA